MVFQIQTILGSGLQQLLFAYLKPFFSPGLEEATFSFSLPKCFRWSSLYPRPHIGAPFPLVVVIGLGIGTGPSWLMNQSRIFFLGASKKRCSF